MPSRPQIQPAGRFALEALEPRMLLSGEGGAAVAMSAPAGVMDAVTVAERPVALNQQRAETSSIFGDVQNLEVVSAASRVAPLQANQAVDPAKLDCLQPLPDGTFAYFIKTQALAGDVTTIDLSGRALGDLALDQPIGTLGKVAELPDWETTLAQANRFLFVPKLPVENGQMDLALAAKTVGDLTDCFGLPVLNGSSVSVTLTIEIRDGYSVAGQNAVTFGTEREDVLRQQQRLAYLGFPGKEGNALVVDGLTGQNTEWASELFNAAILDKNVAAAPVSPLSEFINARNAPRWVEIVAEPGLEIEPNDNGTPQSETWATSWAKEVLLAALQTYRAAHPDDILRFKGASLKEGGPSAHLSHQAGMDVDIDIPDTTNSITLPWYVTRNANGVAYVAASTGNKDIVWKLPNGTYSGAAPPTATGGLPAGLPAGSQPVEQSYADVYDNQAVLRAINDAGLFVLNASYDRADAQAQIDAFLGVNGSGVSTASGAATQNIYYNDPALWGLAPGDPLPQAANLNTPVVFTHDHGGHFHVNIKAPTLVSDGLTATETDAILQGLGGIDEWIRRLEAYDPGSASASQSTLHNLSANTETYALGTGLPFLGRSLGQLISLGDIINNQLIAPVRSYFASDQTPTAGELAGLFGSISFSAGGVTVGVNPQKTSMEIVHLTDHDEVRFNFDLQAERSANLSLLLPTIAQSLGVSLDDSAKLNVTAAVDLEFTFGLSLGANISPANAFFASVKKLDATVTAQASDLKAGGQVAGIAINVTQGTATFGAGVSITLDQARLTLGDLRSKPLNDLVEFKVLPITASASLAVSTSAITIAGVPVVLSGTLSIAPHDIDYSIAASVSDWHPVPFITVNGLTVTLRNSVVTLDTTASIAGVNGVKLKGDYDLNKNTYFLDATGPVNWTLISGVNLSNVRFALSNRNPDRSAGDVRVSAQADLRLFGTDFDVRGSVNQKGAWIAATPKNAFVIVPGLSLDRSLVVATNYDFVFDVSSGAEITGATTPANDNQRKIITGVDLVAAARLPDSVPAIGGSIAEISGVLGTDLSQMALEAKIALAHPPEIAGLLAFDSVGLRVTGDFTLTVFGEGRVLHDMIPGLNEDIAVRAGLTLDLVHTTLKGSLSLLRPLNNFFGVEGLNIIEGDGTFGINFATTPLPLPTVGFNLLVEIPSFAQVILALPPRLSAALNISSTEPIMAMSVENWQPLSKVGLSNLQIKEGKVVVAPNGGTIGLRVFPRGFSAAFIANLFGTDVDFEGRFDEQTKGISLAGYVSSFSIAGVNITGTGPDAIYQDGKTTGGPNDPDNDNGASFTADLTPQKQKLSFSGRVNLPGKIDDGRDAFVQLDGKIDTTGVTVAGQIAHWNVVPQVLSVSAAKFDSTVPFADATKGSVAFRGDLVLLQAPIHLEGALNAQGISFTGSLKSPGSFGGMSVGDFALSFSTLPNDQHFFVQFTVDLPGNGGVTTVRGAFQNQTLVLDAVIKDWQPLPALTFDGTLHALVPLSRPSLDLDFDVTGAILGASAHFTGTISSSPSGFTLFATSDIALRLPTGQKVADLEGTIDLGKDSPFQIGLAGDFPLPGTQSTTAHLQGSIGASGITLFGTIDDWVLVPGLAFDGLVKLRFKAGLSAASIVIGPGRIPVEVDPSVVTDPLPSSTKDLTIQIDVSTSLLGSNLRLLGKLTGNRDSFDFDLTGHVRLTGPLVAGVVLDLDASVVTAQNPLGVRTYRLAFSGDLQIFNGFDAVHINATMQGDSNGNWSLTVEGGVGFDLSATIDDIISLSISASIDGTLVLRSSGNLSFGLAVNGKARARVPSLGFDESVTLSLGIAVDIGAGTATIPDARPKIDHNRLGVATGISWHNYTLNTPTPNAPTPTVKATFIPSVIRNRPGLIQVRGTNSPEQIRVSFLPRAVGSDEDTLVVRGATGSSALVDLLTVSASSVDLLDIDMGGGNDAVTLSFVLRPGSGVPQFRTIVRGGLGSDTITATGITATIYGNRDDATDDKIDGSDVIDSTGGGSTVFGGGGDDLITATGANTVINGGTGYNVINGTLLILGSEGGDHISVTKSTAGTRFLHNPFGTPPASALLIQNAKEQGPVVTLTSVPIENVSRIQIDGLGGNDSISMAADVTLPAIINGGPGTDILKAGPGNDTIQGGDGDDEIFAGAGTNNVTGGNGRDIIHPGAGTTTVQADTEDIIFNDGGTVTIQGGNVAVTNVTINGGNAQRSYLKTIALQFNRDVSASLTADDIELLTGAGEKLVPSTLTWDRTTNTALLSFATSPRDAPYTLTLKSGTIADASGNTLSADFKTNFFILAGDINGDGRVNSLDLLAVSRELIRPDNSRDLAKDANGDGKIDLADLTFVRANYLSKTT